MTDTDVAKAVTTLFIEMSGTLGLKGLSLKERLLVLKAAIGVLESQVVMLTYEAIHEEAMARMKSIKSGT